VPQKDEDNGMEAHVEHEGSGVRSIIQRLVCCMPQFHGFNVMRRPFMEYGRRLRRWLCRYQRIKIMNEQQHGWRVMKYQFSSGAEYRTPIYRIRRKRTYRKYFRIRMSGRAVEKVFQFYRPFRGKAAFKMTAYHPQYGLVETYGDNAVSGIIWG